MLKFFYLPFFSFKDAKKILSTVLEKYPDDVHVKELWTEIEKKIKSDGQIGIWVSCAAAAVVAVMCTFLGSKR